MNHREERPQIITVGGSLGIGNKEGSMPVAEGTERKEWMQSLAVQGAGQEEDITDAS